MGSPKPLGMRQHFLRMLPFPSDYGCLPRVSRYFYRSQKILSHPHPEGQLIISRQSVGQPCGLCFEVSQGLCFFRFQMVGGHGSFLGRCLRHHTYTDATTEICSPRYGSAHKLPEWRPAEESSPQREIFLLMPLARVYSPC